MKKLVLVVCLLVASLAARAQFEQGKWIINPSLTGLNFSYSNSEKAQFGIGAKAGAFLAEGIALMVEASADWSKPIDVYTIGTGTRFYFNKTGVFLGAGLDLNRYRMKGGPLVPNGEWVLKQDTLISFHVRLLSNRRYTTNGASTTATCLNSASR